MIDSNGKETAMIIDFKNKEMRAWAESMREDYLDWKTFEAWKNNPNKESVDFFEATNEILAVKKTSDVSR